MNSEIIEVYIKDLGEVITGNTPPTSERNLYGGTYPLIMPTDMVEGEKYIRQTVETLSEEGYKKYIKNILPKNTPCVVTIGSIGKKLCLTKAPSFTNQAINAIKVDNSRYDPIFVFYLLKYNLPQVKYLSNGTASGRENVSKSSFSKIKVLLPKSLLIQTKIASILSSYDELIENNKQRIKLLEEMAEEIYKEWFVRMRFPGYETAKFYNEQGVEVKRGTEGALPEGWEKKPINSFINIISGYAFKTESFDSEGFYKLVTIKNVQDGYFVTETTDYISELPKNLKKDCILRDKDIILSLTGNVGRICMVYGENYLLNQRVAKLQPKVDYLYEFIYLLFRDKFFRITLENISNGAAQQNLSPIETGKLEVTLADKETIKQFSKATNSFFNEIIVLNKKNLLLQQTRDLLLPRLISGKLSVEHLVEADKECLMAAAPEEEYK